MAVNLEKPQGINFGTSDTQEWQMEIAAIRWIYSSGFQQLFVHKCNAIPYPRDSASETQLIDLSVHVHKDTVLKCVHRGTVYNSKKQVQEENAQAEFQRQRPLKDHYSADMKIKMGNKFSAAL